MRDHLDQESIYLYLDRELPEAELQTLEAHLATCEQCQARVAVAERLFVEIGRLPEVPLSADLSAGVLSRLPLATGWLPRLAVVQLLAALAVGVSLLVGLGGAAVSTRILASAGQLATELEAAAQAVLMAAARSLPDFGSLQPQLGVPTIWTIAVAALALWALSNGVMLRRVTRSRGR